MTTCLVFLLIFPCRDSDTHRCTTATPIFVHLPANIAQWSYILLVAMSQWSYMLTVAIRRWSQCCCPSLEKLRCRWDTTHVAKNLCLNPLSGALAIANKERALFIRRKMCWFYCEIFDIVIMLPSSLWCEIVWGIAWWCARSLAWYDGAVFCEQSHCWRRCITCRIFCWQLPFTQTKALAPRQCNWLSISIETRDRIVWEGAASQVFCSCSKLLRLLSVTPSLTHIDSFRSTITNQSSSIASRILSIICSTWSSLLAVICLLWSTNSILQ